MKIDMQKVGHSLVVRLSGELDMHTSELFRRATDSEFEAKELLHMVLVLSDVGFIDSSGVGAILGRYRRVKERKGKMILVGLRPVVRRVLEMSGVLKITEAADSERRALARL